MKFNYSTKTRTYLTPEEKRKLEKIMHVEIDADKENEVLDAMSGIQKLIRLTGDDEERKGLIDTPFRVVKAFLEYTSGMLEDPKEHLKTTFEVDHQELVLVKNIEFYSTCEHHFSPFYGVAHVGYVPNEKVTGLSKLARVVDGYAKRFQIQEKLGQQVANAIYEELEAQAVFVIIEAKHMCMCSRGVKKGEATTVTVSTKGEVDTNVVTALLK